MNEEYPVNEYDSTGSFAVDEIQSNRQQALEYEEERKKQEALATEQTQQAEATQADPRNADKWGIKAIAKEAESILSGGLQDTASSIATFGERTKEALDGTMRKLIGPMHDAMMDLIPMIDADTDAFTEFVNASRLPKNTPEEIEARDAAMEEGLKTAIRVPLKVMEIGDSCWNNMEELAKHGNMSSVSDLEVDIPLILVGDP